MEQKEPKLSQIDKQLIHDIRNPLTSIRIAHEMIKEELRSSEAGNESLENLNIIISRNISRLEALLHQVINPALKQSRKNGQCDIARIIDTALQRAQDRIFLAGIKVQRDYMRGHLVTCNFEEITDAFLNLVINAIEAARPSQGQLWITVYEIDGWVKVVFKDNGKGIPPGIVDRIAEPFFSCKKAGLGMGLAYVKNILDNHQASIKFLSEEGIGTTIILMFPHSNLQQL